MISSGTSFTQSIQWIQVYIGSVLKIFCTISIVQFVVFFCNYTISRTYVHVLVIYRLNIDIENRKWFKMTFSKNQYIDYILNVGHQQYAHRSGGRSHRDDTSAQSSYAPHPRWRNFHDCKFRKSYRKSIFFQNILSRSKFQHRDAGVYELFFYH